MDLERLQKSPCEGRVLSWKDQCALVTRWERWSAAGFSHLAAFRMLAGDSSPELQAFLKRWIIGLEEGESLTVLVGRDSDRMGPHWHLFLQSAERSGNATEALGRLREFLVFRGALRRGLARELGYPLFLGVLAFMIINLFIFLAVPRLEVSLATLQGGDLAGFSSVVFGFSSFYRTGGYAIIPASVFALWAGFRFWPRAFRWVERLPFWRSALERLKLHQLTHALSMLLDAGYEGMSLQRQWQALAASPWQKRFGEALERGLQRGEPWEKSLHYFPWISPEMVLALEESNQQGESVNLLKSISTQALLEWKEDLSRLTRWLEPLLLLGLGSFTALLALAVYAPIWDMSRSLLAP